MNIDDMYKWVTLGGAVIAAVASALNLWWTYRAKADKIKVSFGSMHPSIAPGYWLHVVSLSEHQMFLRDYGFITEGGTLLSLPDLIAHDIGEDLEVISSAKSSLDKRGEIFEIGNIILRDNQIGAYAVTAGQEHPTLGFAYDVRWYKRALINIKIWWRPIPN